MPGVKGAVWGMQMVQKNLGKQTRASLGLLVLAELCSVATGRTARILELEPGLSRQQGRARKDLGGVKVPSPLRLSPNPHIAFPLLGPCLSSSPSLSYFPLSS